MKTTYLERLFTEIDKLAMDNVELKGYILMTISKDNEIDLIFNGESKEVLLNGISVMIDAKPDIEQGVDDNE